MHEKSSHKKWLHIGIVVGLVVLTAAALHIAGANHLLPAMPSIAAIHGGS